MTTTHALPDAARFEEINRQAKAAQARVRDMTEGPPSRADPANPADFVTVARDGDGGLKLPRIRRTGGDYLKVRHVCRIQRAATLAQSLAVLGMTRDAMLPHVAKAVAERLTDDDLAAWSNHLEAQREILLLSLQRETPGATMDAVDALGLSERESLAAAAAVMGWTIVATQPEQQQQGQQSPPASEVQQ